AKFEGAFHGTHDWVLVSVAPELGKAGSRKRPRPVASSSGVPEAVLKHTVVLPWNDAEACAKILDRHGRDIAALIVDPLMANAGLLMPQLGFLERLREITDRLGIVLIFDEVISFRVSEGGAQQRFGIRPDLTTLGKIIGGGLAVGAFGGREGVMNGYDPRGGKSKISPGGTVNANPLTMAGGGGEGAEAGRLGEAGGAGGQAAGGGGPGVKQGGRAGAGAGAGVPLLDPRNKEEAERSSLAAPRRCRAVSAHLPRPRQRRHAPD